MTRWIAVVCCLVACGTDGKSDSPPPMDSPTSSPTAPVGLEGLRLALEAEGFDVGVGRIEWDAVAECCEWGTCLHINPNGEYGTWAVPPGPGEYVADRDVKEDGTILASRIRADEAMLFVGTPVAGAAYASFRTYVHDRETPEGRELQFQNMGDTLNHLVWETNEDDTLLVLTTADATTRDAVARASASVGWPAVNLDPIQSGATTMGLGETSDSFHTTLRVAGLLDEPAFEAWRDTSGPTVWRLTPREPAAHDPLPVPEVRSAVGLSDPGLEASVEALRQAIVAQYDGWQVLPASIGEREPPPGEPTCWDGCNRDVSYATSQATLVNGQTRVVAYGVDPALLGRSIWTELAVVGTANSDSGGAAGTGMWQGSAAAFVPDDPNVDALYAWTFTRDCSGIPDCTEIPYGCPGIEVLEPAIFAWRHYLDPITGTYPPLQGLGQRGAIKFRVPGTDETTGTATGTAGTGTGTAGTTGTTGTGTTGTGTGTGTP